LWLLLLLLLLVIVLLLLHTWLLLPMMLVISSYCDAHGPHGCDAAAAAADLAVLLRPMQLVQLLPTAGLCGWAQPGSRLSLPHAGRGAVAL
jgi:hypothetical protein